MESPSFSHPLEQPTYVDPRELELIYGSGFGFDYPEYDVAAHADEAIDLPDHNANANERSSATYAHLDLSHDLMSDEDAPHELIDDSPINRQSTIDPEATMFSPASEIEEEYTIDDGVERGLEPLHPTESPPTPRIEVSAPDAVFPTNKHAGAGGRRRKSRPQSRQSSPGDRSASTSRPRAQSVGQKKSTIPRAFAAELVNTVDSMSAALAQDSRNVGGRPTLLSNLNASFPPPMPGQGYPYSGMRDPMTLAPSVGGGYRCTHNGCTESARVWDTKSERDHHERKHVPKNKRAHACGYCEKTFHFPKDLKRHMVTHNGESVTCPVCHGEYSRLDNLKRHIKTRHQGAQSSRSGSQMSSHSPTPSLTLNTNFVQSPIDDIEHVNPWTLSPLDARASPSSKSAHHRHDSVNEPASYECHKLSESPLSAQPMSKSYSNRI